MARTTFENTLRNRPSKDATAAVVLDVLQATFDPTSVSQVSLGFLPKDAIVTSVTSLGGATGGVSPTVDIGTSGDPDGFADELPADAVSYNNSGALTGTVLASDTEVFGVVGASAATGGTVRVLINYIMLDDGKR